MRFKDTPRNVVVESVTSDSADVDVGTSVDYTFADASA